MTSIDRTRLDSALEEIRPHLHGELQLVSVEGGRVAVRLTGRCTDCAMQEQTLRLGVEAVLRARVPGVREVVAVGES